MARKATRSGEGSYVEENQKYQANNMNEAEENSKKSEEDEA